ncbi:MAG: hypothetical protein J6Y11_13890 [Paludibacteraceae bacterium]|nr:hypothetical protein [Paludibacteraceae bacterium]
MKDLIIEDFARSWRALDPGPIIFHLSNSFIYHSQWVSEILDYNGYVDYLRCKFRILQLHDTGPKVTIVDDDLWGGKMLRLSSEDTTAYFRIMIKGEKVYLGWLSKIKQLNIDKKRL